MKKGVPHIESGTPFFPLISNPIVIPSTHYIHIHHQADFLPFPYMHGEQRFFSEIHDVFGLIYIST